MNNESNNIKPYWWPDMQGFAVVAIIVVTATALFIRMFRTSNVDDKMLDTMITILFSTCLVSVFNYLFGSSRGSASKDEALTKIASNTPPPPATDATKVLPVLAAILVAGSMLMFGSPASAQKPLPHLQITGDFAKDTKANFGLTGNASADMQALAQKIAGSAINDLNYAAAMARSANTLQATKRLDCINALISLNKQMAGTDIKDENGAPMTRPDPHLFSDVETLAETIDALQPTGPLFVGCAAAAQLAKTNVFSFVSALVTGAAGFAAMPIIPGL